MRAPERRLERGTPRWLVALAWVGLASFVAAAGWPLTSATELAALAARASTPPGQHAGAAPVLLTPAAQPSAVAPTRQTSTSTARPNPSTARSATAVRYAIVVTGEELLTGVYADAHTQFLTQTLRPLGYRCVLSVCVGDDEDEIVRTLKFVAPRVDFVLVTGGLGPTDTDVTRQALSRFTGTRLRLDADVVHHVERRFGRAFQRLPAGVQREALVPEGGHFLPNRRGTAVGLVFEGRPLVVALPGPPSELRPMVTDELVPRLVKRFGRRPEGCSFRLRFVGLGQSQITDTLHRRVHLPADVVQTSQFHAGRVDFTFEFPSRTPADRRRMEALKSRILHELGPYVYADDDTSLEERVLQLLKTAGQRLAVLECFTGGRLSASLSRCSAASGTLVGAMAGPSEKTLEQLVSRCSRLDSQPTSDAPPDSAAVSQREHARKDAVNDTAVAVAQRARRQLAADWVVWVGEARPSETGRDAQAVRVLVVGPDNRLVQRRLSVRNVSDETRDRVVTRVLDLLRRALTGGVSASR